MAASRKIFDAVVLHRTDVLRLGRSEAVTSIRMLAGEDAKLVAMLRQRLPNVRAGDIRGERLKQLMRSARELRRDSFAKVRTELTDKLVAFGQAEGPMLNAVVQRAIGAKVSFAPVGLQRMRAAVTQDPFSGGRGASHTLGQWFEDLRKRDQQRLLGAVQAGVFRNEPVDVTVRRIAGTAAADYSDGLLSISRRSAETAVRTAYNHTANAAQLAWGEANKDVVIGFEWTAILDDRTEVKRERRDLDERLNAAMVAFKEAMQLERVARAAASPPADHAQVATTDGRDAAVVRAEQQAEGNTLHQSYLVFTPDERRRGFVRPVRRCYQHVGIRPKHPLRDLTPEETARFESYGYVAFEAYPAGESVSGKYWTRASLSSGCGAVTRMGEAIAETYARSPSFYGATFCSNCGAHYPVGEHGEFEWLPADGGGKVGT